MTNIFFGCSMRGGYERLSQEELRKIPKAIEELGYKVLSTHQTQENVISEEDKLSDTEVFERDYRWLMDADAGIFEITNPSIGTGIEIAFLSNMKRPILCLYKEPKRSISKCALGMQGSEHIKSPFECQLYANIDDAKEIIAKFLGKYS